MNGILFKKYNASLLQCSQKVSFCPETGKILFSYHSRAADPWFCPLTFLYPNRLVPKCFGFLSFWGNSGLVSGPKLTFCEHCMLKSTARWGELSTCGRYWRRQSIYIAEEICLKGTFSTDSSYLKKSVSGRTLPHSNLCPMLTIHPSWQCLY